MSGPNLSGYTVQEPRQPIGFTTAPQRIVVVRAARHVDTPAPDRPEVTNVEPTP